MANITLRAAHPNDAPTIAAIYRAAVLEGTASFEIEPPDAAEMARRMAAIVDAGYPYLVAELAGAVTGYGYLNAYRPRPAYRWSVENSIYVANESQGHGIGRQVLQALIAKATTRGYRQMIAVIGDSANIASTRLHRACGFQFCGTVHAVGFKSGRWLDSVTMQRPLGDGDTSPPTQIAASLR
jgi:L-amino acid N-acyltransferase YncA